MPIPRLYSLKRLLVTGWPFVVLLAAWLSVKVLNNRSAFRTAAITVSLAAALVSLLLVGKDDWRGATAHINNSAKPDDIVWLDPNIGILPYDYYEPLIEPSFGVEAVEQHPNSEVWHIAERQPNRPIPGSSAEIWLDENRDLLQTIPLYRLEVRHYSAER